MTDEERLCIVTKEEYKKSTIDQKLAYHDKERGLPVDEWCNPTTVIHEEHLYHVCLAYSAKDNSILECWRLHENGWSDKNKRYKLVGSECVRAENPDSWLC